MSRERANIFLRYRGTQDPHGDLVWASRLSKKALRAGPDASERIDVEREFELTSVERVIWRVLKLPRRYDDLEGCGLLSPEQIRKLLRCLVAADVVDILEVAEGKALLPVELRRLEAEVAGAIAPQPREPLRARVYRPPVDGEVPSQPKGPSQAPETPRVTPREARVQAPRSTADLTADLTADERAFKADMLRLHAAMTKQSHYDFMGLARGCDDAAVKQAYIHLARLYHPDRAAAGNLGGDDELRLKIDALFKRLGDAHHRLGTQEQRAAYDRELEALTSTPNSADGKRPRRPLEAQNALKMAETFFKKKDFKSAEAHFRQAMLFDGDDPKIATAFAFFTWLNPDTDENSRNEEARRQLEQVLQKHKHADAAYKLGLVLQRMGDEAGAQKKFAAAHRMDATHVDAQREVRLAAMRQQKNRSEEAVKDAKAVDGRGRQGGSQSAAPDDKGRMRGFLGNLLKK